MKKLSITKEAFEKSKYFKNKYGKLEYVSESGKVFKTEKGKILMFKESSEGDDPQVQRLAKKFTKENVEATGIEELYEELKVKYGIKKPRYLDNDTFLEMDGGQIFCGLDRSEFPGVRTYTKANNQFCQELVEWMKENHPDFEVEWEPGDAKTGKNEPVLIYKIEPRRMLEKFTKESMENGDKLKVEMLCKDLERNYDTLKYDEIEDELREAGFQLDEYGGGLHGRPAYAVFVHPCGIVVNIEYLFVRTSPGKDSWLADAVTDFYWMDDPEYQRWSTESAKKFGRKFSKEGTESNPRFKCMENRRRR